MSPTRILFCLFVIAYLAGCRDGEHDSASAPPITPSENGECGWYRSQLQQKVAVANRGDAAEMYALGNYYAVCDGRDAEGELWMERAADAGFEKAQKYVLDSLDESESEADHVRAKELRSKWNLPQSSK